MLLPLASRSVQPGVGLGASETAKVTAGLIFSM
jgi:hypothetical protein